MKNIRIWSFSGLYFPHFDIILRISPYSVQMRGQGNKKQKNSEYKYFLRSKSYGLRHTKLTLLMSVLHSQTIWGGSPFSRTSYFEEGGHSIIWNQPLGRVILPFQWLGLERKTYSTLKNTHFEEHLQTTAIPTSRWYVPEQGVIIPDISETLQSSWSHSSASLILNSLILASQFSNLTGFLPLKKTLVATFNETRAPTSRKYVAEQGIIMPNQLQTLHFLWLHSSIYCFRKIAWKY